MNVISIIAQKGGSGKTTVTLSLAVAALRAGQSVAVIDLDPQVSACSWGDRRNSDPVIISVQAARLKQTLAIAAQNGANIVFIDTPPRAADAALAAAEAANLILIPCRPAIFDLQTLQTTMQLINSTGTKGHTAVMLNSLPPRGAQREQAEAAIRDMNIPVLPCGFGQRAVFSHAAAVGLTAQEYEPAGKGAQEIEQVYKFACKLLNSKTNQQENNHVTAKTRSAASA